MKIKTFITAIIMIVFAVAVSIVLLELNNTLITNATNDIGNAVSKIVLIPIEIVLMIISASLTIGSFISSIVSITSENKAIKIISIFLLVISLGLIAFNTYNIIQFFTYVVA